MSALERRVRGRLDAWRGDGLLRTMRVPLGHDFSSNDYLTLSKHPAIAARFAEAAAREVGSTGSRLLRGEREAFADLETRFARFKGTEGALYFSSGYLANLAAISTFTEADDVIFSDERNHASIIDAVRLSSSSRVIVPHADPAALERLLRITPCTGHRFVVVESLFSMDGDLAPLQEYGSLCRAFDATLVVDEAHAVGIYGERGTGLIEALRVEQDVCISVNTAGKALGVGGAFVNGPRWAIDYLIQRARPFVFSTAPPPALAAAIDAGLDIVTAEPERRRRVLMLAGRLRSRLSEAGIIPAGQLTQIVPVIVGDNEQAIAVSRALEADGFDVRAIRPPTVPAGTARLRISINAGLAESIIDGFAAALVTTLKEAGVCFAGSS